MNKNMEPATVSNIILETDTPHGKSSRIHTRLFWTLVTLTPEERRRQIECMRATFILVESFCQAEPTDLSRNQLQFPFEVTVSQPAPPYLWN